VIVVLIVMSTEICNLHRISCDGGLFHFDSAVHRQPNLKVMSTLM